jgi:hypothetical protein
MRSALLVQRPTTLTYGDDVRIRYKIPNVFTSKKRLAIASEGKVSETYSRMTSMVAAVNTLREDHDDMDDIWVEFDVQLSKKCRTDGLHYSEVVCYEHEHPEYKSTPINFTILFCISISSVLIRREKRQRGSSFGLLKVLRRPRPAPRKRAFLNKND